MAKSWRWCLSLLVLAHISYGQPGLPLAAADPCSRPQYRDSLVARYLTQGAQKLRNSYLDPRWALYCDSLIARCPDIAEAYQQKAVPLIKDGLYAEAFALENKAVALDPNRWLAYRGYLKCIKTKDYEGALLDFQRVARLKPNGREMDHTYPFFLGLCHLELGEFEQAEVDFKEDVRQQRTATKDGSIHFNTLFYIGVLYTEMKNYSQAARYLRQCLRAYPQHPDANYYLALTYQAQGQQLAARRQLVAAQQALAKGYQLNEDNTVYQNYPHQITAYEVQVALSQLAVLADLAPAK